jgi:hypothetical protein
MASCAARLCGVLSGNIARASCSLLPQALLVGYLSDRNQVVVVYTSASSANKGISTCSRVPECTRFAAFATLCIKEGTEMPGLLETRQRVKTRFCMTSFSCVSGKLRNPVPALKPLAGISSYPEKKNRCSGVYHTYSVNVGFLL